MVLQDILNICDEEHLSMYIDFKKMIYNIVSFEKQLHYVRKNILRTFKSIIDDYDTPMKAIILPSRYWCYKAPQAVKQSRAIPILIVNTTIYSNNT